MELKILSVANGFIVYTEGRSGPYEHKNADTHIAYTPEDLAELVKKFAQNKKRSEAHERLLGEGPNGPSAIEHKKN